MTVRLWRSILEHACCIGTQKRGAIYECFGTLREDFEVRIGERRGKSVVGL